MLYCWMLCWEFYWIYVFLSEALETFQLLVFHAGTFSGKPLETHFKRRRYLVQESAVPKSIKQGKVVIFQEPIGKEELLL